MNVRALVASLASSSTAIKRVLVLGAGGGALPMALLSALPHAKIDAVEIDERVVLASKLHFGVGAAVANIESSRLTIHTGA